MIYILHITKQLSRNGTETFIMNLFREAIKHNIFFDFLLLSNKKDGYYEEAIKLGAKIYHIPTRRTPLKYYKALNSFFSKHSSKYRGVHFSGNSLSSIAPLIFAKKYLIPIRIYHSHNSSCHKLYNRIFHTINKFLLPIYATDGLACSQTALKWAYSHTSLEKRALIINNGIDLSMFKFRQEIRNNMRIKLGLNNKLVIGHIGRFVTEKNHKFIIEIFYELHKKNPNTYLLLIGAGELEHVIRYNIDLLGISDYVYFLGIRNDIPDLMMSMDLFLMPSLFEGLPFVLIEAQASGLPILASDIITHEVAVSPFCHFENLKKTAKTWADRIEELTINQVDRFKANDYMKEYDSRMCMSKIFQIYNRIN